MAGSKQIQDEMARFEAELAGTLRPTPSSLMRPSSVRGANPSGSYGHGQSFQGKPTLFVPTQLQRAGVRPAVPAQAPIGSSFAPTISAPATVVAAAVISNKPVLYKPENESKPAATSGANKTLALSAGAGPAPKKTKVEAKSPTKQGGSGGPSALKAPSSTIGSATVKPATEEPKKTMKKPKKFVRAAGGQTWQDDSLLDWDPNDFRIFCGDLGNDVTDEVLARIFGRYPSFQKAKVVRDHRSNKTKGYGFVSFKDPADFTRAMKEMNGKYVGSRPIKLRKSNWKNRNIDEVKKRQREKDVLLGKRAK